jgi:hypothetical protein
MNRSGENSAGMDAIADLREEIALQIEEIADQLVGVGRDDELAALQVGEACFEREAGSLRA